MQINRTFRLKYDPATPCLCFCHTPASNQVSVVFKAWYGFSSFPPIHHLTSGGSIMLKILLVEDDKTIVTNLTEYLNGAGYIVRSVSGQAAATTSAYLLITVWHR